jgi:hypothetical protein
MQSIASFGHASAEGGERGDRLGEQGAGGSNPAIPTGHE